MTSILQTDLKLLTAARHDDTDDSGGYPSNSEILDNVDNNLFPDVASGDRVAGRTHLRKLFAAVRNPSTEPLLAARVYLSLPPEDAAVSVCLLDSGGGASDTRPSALEAIYIAAQPSVNTGVRLFQNYSVGESVLSVYWVTEQSPPFAGLPSIGDAIFLQDDTNNAEQYVRVTSISIGPLTATLSISPPLAVNLRGGWNDEVDYVTPTQLYLTRSTPLGHGIYGITPLAAAAETGDVAVQVTTTQVPVAPQVYEQLETVLEGGLVRKTTAIPAVSSLLQSITLGAPPVLDDIVVRYFAYFSQQVTISGATSPDRFTVVGNTATVRLTENPVFFRSFVHTPPVDVDKTVATATLKLGVALGPDSIQITALAASTLDPMGGADDGDGVITGYGGLTGTVDYDNGILALAFSPEAVLASIELAYTYQSAGTYRHQTPAVQPVSALTVWLGTVTAESMTVTASRVDTGATITGTDTAGVISGTGLSGTVDYSTGRTVLTFATPVYGNSILIAYTKTAERRLEGTGAQGTFVGYYPVSSYTVDLGNTALATGKVSVHAWDAAAGVFYTATDDGLGAFDHDGITGTVNYATAEIDLDFAEDVIYRTIVIAYTVQFAHSPIYWEYAAASDDTDFVFALQKPVIPSTVTIQANAVSDSSVLTATDDGSGGLTGDATGTLDAETGALAITFSEAVTSDSIFVTYRYTASSTANSLVGGTLDVVRLPSEKSFPLVKTGDMAMIHYPLKVTLPNPVSAGTTYPLGRSPVTRIWMEDAAGTQIPTNRYTANLALGTVTLAADFDGSLYNQPLSGWTVLANEVLITGQENDTLRFIPPLTADYPASAAYLSTGVPVGDLFASVSRPFSQQAWTSVWQDTLIGTAITAQYNDTVYPIQVTNDGAISERWRIQFVTSTTVHIIGEHVGQITFSTLSTTETIAPLNPYTGQPYFILDPLGWGSGWVAGNLLRLNTQGADYGVWAIRCVQPSVAPAPGTPDRVRLTLIGDVDA